ncbi:MAG: hypothetical protein PUK70_00805 [Bacteroidales bacterium]|nr:hypothetical protein [Bacteroidales bacterium]MDY6001514.1 hypothetical protein [Candidatus Cryptobacteroides sp.]
MLQGSAHQKDVAGVAESVDLDGEIKHALAEYLSFVSLLPFADEVDMPIMDFLASTASTAIREITNIAQNFFITLLFLQKYELFLNKF